MPEPRSPIEIFNELPLKEDGNIKELWDSQKEVIEKYFNEHKDKTRIAIELPTGSGKSIIGILILEMWRRLNKKVAIVTANKDLAKDLADRCEDMGINNVILAADLNPTELQGRIFKYNRSRSIAIMNYWAYIYKNEIPIPDVLVVDDAHGFEDAISSYYSIRIPRSVKNEEGVYSLYREILGLIERRFPIYNITPYLKGDISNDTVELLSFNNSSELKGQIKELLNRDLPEEILWQVRYNKDRFDGYLLLLSRDEILLRPYIIPSDNHQRIKNINQIIFMSATFGTKELMHKTLGSPIEISLLTEKDITCEIKMGKHLILPLSDTETSSKISKNSLDIIIQIVTTFNKVLILANSHRDAHKIVKYLKIKLGDEFKIIFYNKEGDMKQFKYSETEKSVLVVPGRYLGMDFPGDICRVAIITRVPYIVSPLDAFVKNKLMDKDTINKKVSQRLVQAFGRCNREREDYAVYFVLDTRFSADVAGDKDLFPNFPFYMRAETETGYILSEMGSTDKAIKYAKDFLSGDSQQFDEEILEYTRGYSRNIESELNEPYNYLFEINAWHKLTNGDYESASGLFLECAESIIIDRDDDIIKTRKAWLYYCAAICHYLDYKLYGNQKSKNHTIEALKSATEFGKTPWFNRLSATINEIETGSLEEESTLIEWSDVAIKEKILLDWKQFERDNTNKKKNRLPIQKIERIKEILATGSHNEICNALEELSKLFGFTVENLKDVDGKPDLILHSLMNSVKYKVPVEVKSKEEGGLIKIEDVNQANGYANPIKREYPDYDVFPFLFHNKENVGDHALNNAKGAVTICDNIILSSLIDKLYSLMEESWRLQSFQEINLFMQKMFTPKSLIAVFRPKEDAILSIEDFNKI